MVWTYNGLSFNGAHEYGSTGANLITNLISTLSPARLSPRMYVGVADALVSFSGAGSDLWRFCACLRTSLRYLGRLSILRCAVLLLLKAIQDVFRYGAGNAAENWRREHAQ